MAPGFIVGGEDMTRPAGAKKERALAAGAGTGRRRDRRERALFEDMMTVWRPFGGGEVGV